MRRIFIAILIAAATLFSCAEAEQEVSEVRESIVGDWYSNDIGGYFCFGADNTFSLKIDMTGTMYIDSDNIAHIADSDEDYSSGCSFDGMEYKFELNGIEMIDMIREEKADSAFGEYTLKGGILYEQLSEKYGELDDRYSIIVGEDVFDAKIRMCDYSEKDGVLTFSGDDFDFFNSSEGKVSVFNFAVHNDVLTIVNGDETLVFSRD